MVIAAGSEEPLKLWDVATGKERPALPGHTGKVEYLAAFPGGKRFVTATSKDIKVWDSAAALRPLNGARTDLVRGQPESPPEEPLLSFLPETATLQGPPGEVWQVAISPSGRWLAAASDQNPIVKVWDLPARKEAHALRGHASPVFAVRFSPDGKVLYSADAGAQKPGQVKAWDVASGREKFTLTPLGGIGCLALSPDGTVLAAGATARTRPSPFGTPKPAGRSKR